MIYAWTIATVAICCTVSVACWATQDGWPLLGLLAIPSVKGKGGSVKDDTQ